MKDFKTKVIEFIKRIPKGKVVSYGQVAAFAGSPRAARQVGMILRNVNLEPINFAKNNANQKITRKDRDIELLLGHQKGRVLQDIIIESIPWWRVLNNKGIISIKGNWMATKEYQKEFLIQDGISVNANFTINMETYRWKGE